MKGLKVFSLFLMFILLISPVLVFGNSNNALRMVPSWADLVLYVNITELINQEIIMENEEVIAGLQTMEQGLQAVGVDLRSDILWAVGGMRIPHSVEELEAVPDFAVVARVNYQVQEVRNYVNEQIATDPNAEIEVAPYNAAPAYILEVEGGQLIYLGLLQNYVVLTSDLQIMDTMVALSNNRGSNITTNAGMKAIIDDVSSADIGYIASIIPEELWDAINENVDAQQPNQGGPGIASLLSTFNAIKSVSLKFESIQAEEYLIELNLNTDNRNANTQLYTNLTGLWNMFAAPMLQADPNTAPLANNITIENRGTKTTISVLLNQVFFDVIEKLSEEEGGMIPDQPPQQQRPQY